MQIQKISIFQSQIHNHSTLKTHHNNVRFTPVSQERVLDYMSQSHFVNFKGTDFKDTVKRNYFQLPSGALPDIFQKAAAENLYLGNDVIVTAPTGTGKTAIAHYVITKNLEDGYKTFYTTPLKALSNEKFKDFQRIYGKNNVGLLTGDTKTNIDAPVVIMTTEVYRNMVFGNNFKDKNKMLNNLKTVVFDELHYLGDVDRGGIWEQSIILSDPKTQLLSLSATIGNKKEVADWMSKIRPQGKLEIAAPKNADDSYNADKTLPKHTVLVDVPPENRHVPLKISNLKVEAKETEFSQVFSNSISKSVQNETSEIAGNINAMPKVDAYVDVVRDLRDKDKLPAIIFIFSKKGCNAVMKYLCEFGPKLTTKEDEEEIQNIILKYKSKNKYLGESLNLKALSRGYAMHNSGLLPTQKELIEELFQKKLIKVVFATETLSAGINMPARTTIITSTRKPSSTPDSSDGKRFLSPNEFHQMAGRAGRRGIDDIGYCYALSVNDAQESKFNELINATSNPLKSAFNPDYSFIAGYYNMCDDDSYIEKLFSKSFFAYDENPEIQSSKGERLLKMFNTRKIILQKTNFLTAKNTLTQKGQMLTALNGYEQIPIINYIYNKDFKNLNAVELATAVSAFANIEPKSEDKENIRRIKQTNTYKCENTKLEDFIANLDRYIGEYNGNMKKSDKKFKKVALNKEAITHVYEWARSNSIYKDTKMNWNKLYFGPKRDTIRDEGSMFKEIVMTTDLLKQMQDIAKIGETISKSKDDIQYYKKLQTTLKEAYNLLYKEPVADISVLK